MCCELVYSTRRDGVAAAVDYCNVCSQAQARNPTLRA